MSIHARIDPKQADFIPHEELVAALSQRAARTFDLHPALFAGTIGCYLGFLAITAIAFMTPELIIPFAIFTLFIVAGFGVPALWARVAPKPDGRPGSWAEFMREGIGTATGHLSGGAAVAQVMTVPILILAWSVAVLVIRATI